MANLVSVINLGSQTVKATIPVGSYPYTVVFGADGKHAYVSNWADATVSAIDLAKVTTAIGAAKKTPVSVRNATTTIKVGNHPTAMVFSPDGSKLYVADANSDAISVVNTATNLVVGTISVSPYKGAPLSSSPVSLAISANGSTLYAADAGEDAIAVIDTASGTLAGRIPTAWYPSGVVLSKDGSTLFVVNAKGTGGGANDAPASDPNPTRKVSYDSYCNCSQDQYTGSYIMGSLSAIPVPTSATLAGYTAEVARNNHVDDPALLQRSTGNPIPIPGGTSPFTHVIYINKENRTYDQVFGDIRGANGDPSLTLFGSAVTPNLHALVTRFGVLDNFYADAEVSADGHNWINGAYASDYNEKMWPIDYSWGLVYRNRGYDFEGGSLINLNPGGYLWDSAHAAGVTYRDYGDFNVDSTSYILAHIKILPESQAAACPGPVAHTYLNLPKGVSIPPGAVLCFPAEQINAKATPNLVGHFDPKYRTFDLGYSEADRYAEWKSEFDKFVANGKLPALELLRIPNDHTAGTTVGARTPQAYVAENDLYVGEVVDAVSHSPYWKNTLIVVTEDDAQNGPDHVDGHRTTSLIISGYNSHNQLTVDHTLYDTASMVRTVELVLGLKPLSQFDAQATPMWRLLGSTFDPTPYSVTPETLAPTVLNTKKSPSAALSATMNFQVEDRAPAAVVNRIVWSSVKGTKSPYPVSHYSVLNGDDDK
jgi:YVTN family beta-propeller protein